MYPLARILGEQVSTRECNKTNTRSFLFSRNVVRTTADAMEPEESGRVVRNAREIQDDIDVARDRARMLVVETILACAKRFRLKDRVRSFDTTLKGKLGKELRVRDVMFLMLSNTTRHKCNDLTLVPKKGSSTEPPLTRPAYDALFDLIGTNYDETWYDYANDN